MDCTLYIRVGKSLQTENLLILPKSQSASPLSVCRLITQTYTHKPRAVITPCACAPSVNKKSCKPKQVEIVSSENIQLLFLRWPLDCGPSGAWDWLLLFYDECASTFKNFYHMTEFVKVNPWLQSSHPLVRVTYRNHILFIPKRQTYLSSVGSKHVDHPIPLVVSPIIVCKSP